MSKQLASDKIMLRQCDTSTVSIRAKLDALLAEDIPHDDIYGLVIPLLIQGKVRLESGQHSERLELADPSHRQVRSEAVRIFEEYLVARGIDNTAEGSVVAEGRGPRRVGETLSATVTQRIVIRGK